MRFGRGFAQHTRNGKQDSENASIHQAWIRFVLEELLELDQACIRRGQIPGSARSQVAEHGERLRPDAVVVIRERPGFRAC